MLKLNQPIQTKCGWPARVVGTLQRTSFPLVVAVMNPAFGAEELHCYNMDGSTPIRAVYASGDAVEGQEGAEHGALSLVNVDVFEQLDNWKPTDHTTPFVEHLSDWPLNTNPCRLDLSNMHTVLVKGWHLLHSGYDNEKEPHQLNMVHFYNARSGQRFTVHLPVKASLK